MKRGKRKNRPGLLADGHLIRGFVAAGCIAAFQDVARPGSRKSLKRTLRHALQGGTALAAGSAAVEALQQGSYGRALAAAAAGAASVMIIENLLRDGAEDQKE